MKKPTTRRMSPARKQPDTSTYSGRFAVRLRSLREKAGLTVEEMSEKTGIHWRTLYGWEAGRTEPNFDSLPILAEVLGLEPRTILPKK